MRDKTIEGLVLEACIADDNIKRSEVAMEFKRRFAEDEHKIKVLERAVRNMAAGWMDETIARPLNDRVRHRIDRDRAVCDLMDGWIQRAEAELEKELCATKTRNDTSKSK